MILLHRKPRGRVINTLRQLYPGALWRYDRRSGAWRNESAGWHVYRCAALSPKFDGDDDSFETQYRRSDTGARVFLFV